VTSLDLAGLGRQPQRLWCDAQDARRVGEIEPGLDAIGGSFEHWNAMVRT
jgi:hypothetical protein